MKKRRCIWKRGQLIPVNKHQQTKNWPGVIWTHNLNVPNIFFPSARILILKMRLDSELHVVPSRIIILLVPSMLYLSGHLPQLLTKILLLPRCNSLRCQLHVSIMFITDAVINMVQIAMPANTVADMGIHLCWATISFCLKDILQHFHNALLFIRVLCTQF